MADIFISYARTDRDKVLELASALSGNGYDVWWDREIAGGIEFSAAIERELIAAKTVVVAWSEASLQSHWVRDEADFARSANKLLPLSLDGSSPPLGFRQIHALDFKDWDGDPSHRAFEELIASLGEPERALPDIERKVAIAPKPSSIAVLPFTNMSPDPDQDYFSDGMAEEVINALSTVPGLLIPGRTSCFSFKGKNVDVREIGRALNVKHVLEGSVRKQGERVRITTQLVRASDGFQMWSERYDGTLDNVFDLQDQIAQAIVGELKALLGTTPNRRLAKKLTDNNEAYDLFLRARGLLNRFWGDETLPRSIELLEKAVALDPDFVSAWELLARANLNLPLYVAVRDEGARYEAAATAAKRALEINPKSRSAQTSLTYSTWDGSDFVHFLEEIQASMVPSEKFASLHGFQRLMIGRISAALTYFLKALEQDPLSGLSAYQVGQCYLSQSKFALAEEMFQRAIEGGFGGAIYPLSNLIAFNGDPDAAYDLIMNVYDAGGYTYASQLGSREPWDALCRARIYDDPEAQDLVENAIVDAVRNKREPINYRMLNALLCERSAETFFQLYREHQSPAKPASFANELWHPFPRARGMRQHPGFKEFAEEIGLVGAWQEYGWSDLARPEPGTDGSNGAWVID